MAKETYQDKIKAMIGRVKAEAEADNYFPLIGSNVAITAKTKWGQSSEWQTQNGNGETVTADGSLVNQSDNTSIKVINKGELTQRFIARNSLSEIEVQKTLYAMESATHPYFEVTMSSEIVRADGETTDVIVKYEHGYSGVNTMQVRIYKANEETNPVYTVDQMVEIDGGKKCSVSFSIRGQYDVEVDVTDTVTGVMFCKRINKLITVTPRLSPEPADRSTGYRDIPAVKAYTTYSGKNKVDFNFRLWENTGDGLHYAELPVPAGEQNDTSWYEAIDVSVLPAGTTLVLTIDPQEPHPGYARRVLLRGNNPTSVSAESGTPNASYEKPLIITHAQETPYDCPFQSYGGWNFDANIRHIVIDGRGYRNLRKGFHIHKYSPEVFGETCIFMTNGTSNVEIFEVEFSDVDFTAMMAKTDPDPNRPWYWSGNWEFANLWLHHCHIHDTHGEGFYFGYFTPETKQGVNNSGQSLTYRAHPLTNTLIYRNLFENNGYDGIQLSNAFDAEVCYNELYNSASRNEKDQCSGMSIQGMSGRCYNNVVRKFNGAGIQANPLGQLEIFNNVVSGCGDGSPGIQFLFSRTIPEQNPEGNDINENMRIYVHNNTIECSNVGINGRNTVQVKGLYFEDNILIYRTAVFGNMVAGTIERWESQASGNLFIKQKVRDFVEIDSQKIADSANGNWQIAHNSPLIKAGNGSRFKFDFRGYKSWFGTMAPTGAFMGVYKDASVMDDPITLTNVVINQGAISTTERKVTVKLTYTGAVTRCRLSEVSDFSVNTGWITIPGTGVVDYELTEGYGAKIVYAQVSGGTITSNTRSSSIELASIPLTLEAVTLNGGVVNSRHLTVSVSFVSKGSFPAVQYRLGENSDLSDLDWLPMSKDITYTFTTVGVKTLFAQLKDSANNITEIRSGMVTISDLAPIATISLGWNNVEIPWQTTGLSVFDSTLGITRFNSQHNVTSPRTIYDNYGEVFGTAVPSNVMLHMFTHPTTKGSITGDDSGVYPDKYLEHVSVCANSVATSVNIALTIKSGKYNVSLLCNTIIKTTNDAIAYKVITATDSAVVELPATGVQNNTSEMTLPVTVTVGDDKLLKIEFAITGTVAGYWHAPLNIIKIEQQ